MTKHGIVLEQFYIYIPICHMLYVYTYVHTNIGSVNLSFQAIVVDEDGSQVMTFPNGTRKVINTDGSVSMYFFNGDSKQIKPDNTVVFNNLVHKYNIFINTFSIDLLLCRIRYNSHYIS